MTATLTARHSSRPASVAGDSLAHRPLAIVLAVGLTALAGLVAAWLMPRGPATSAEALLWMAGASLLGAAGGIILASRWYLLIGPATFLVSYELARAGTTGPTVDAIHLDSMYGIIAFVVGRGVTYLLALPMLLGAVLGVELASRRRGVESRRLGPVGWVVTLFASLATVALAVAIGTPATTAPIVGVGGQPVPGSVAELIRVPLDGGEQAVMVRGRDTTAPVLLHLAGGPGGTDLGAMRADTSLEDAFVVATWEQRGVGKSYASLDPVATLTLDGAIADTIAMSEYLRDRFGKERIYLHGNSWGSTLAVLAAQQRPDLYEAVVGSGQMVSQRETDIMFYEDTLAWARSTGNDDLVETLERNGRPPYRDVLAYEPALSHEHDWNTYAEWDSDGELPFTLFVPENDLMDRVNGLRSFLDTFALMYPQLQAIDFREDVPRLDVPIYLVMGAHEARGRAVLADEWFEMLEAPSKERIVFERSGHRPAFEEPARFASLMSRVVAETSS